MRISAKSEYACLAMLSLARPAPGDPPVRIRTIAEAHGIPERYLVQILLHLKGAGLVVSTRGALGGYRLSRPASSISLAEVLTAIDGPESPPKVDAKPGSQALATVWEHVRAAERSVLDRTSIAELAALTSPRDWTI
jgi:Rrf2 family protein